MDLTVERHRCRSVVFRRAKPEGLSLFAALFAPEVPSDIVATEPARPPPKAAQFAGAELGVRRCAVGLVRLTGAGDAATRHLAMTRSPAATRGCGRCRNHIWGDPRSHCNPGLAGGPFEAQVGDRPVPPKGRPAQYARPMRRAFALFSLVMFITAVSAVPAAASNRPKLKHTVQSSAPTIGELPVISCSTTYGAPPSGTPFVAHQLATTTAVRGMSYYSNGQITFLAPAGWACSALVAGDGGQALAVYPAGKPDYTAVPIPKGAQIVEVFDDYTGHLPGAELVCGFFPHSAAASFVASGGMSCPAPPSAERTAALTPDVVTFSDPPGVSGAGSGSGGSLTSVGAAVYPQLAYGATDSVDVSVLSCTLPPKQASLCRAIEGDFLVRNPPAYVPQNSG